MRIAIVLLGLVLLASLAASQDRTDWVKRTRCTIDEPYGPGSWAKYTFELVHYKANWVMSCVAASETAGNGTTWSASRYGVGEFGKGEFKDKPVCVIAHPIGFLYRFNYDEATNRVRFISQNEQTVIGKCLTEVR